MKIKQNLYAVFDKTSGFLHEFTLATNDAMAARNVLLTLRVPLKDSELIFLGVYSADIPDNCKQGSLSFDLNASFNLSSSHLVPWSVYKFPDSVSEAVAPLDCTLDEVREITLNHIKNCSSNREESQKIVDKIYNKE